MADRKRILALFDVDGTLTPARQRVSDEMLAFIEELKGVVDVGVVGGSDLAKQKEQLGDDVFDRFRYSFSENGLVAFEQGQSLGSETMAAFLGEERLQELINFTLLYIANLKMPVKRGTFIEFRSGMLNISPIGRNCSREERNAFEAWDREHGCRRRMVDVLRRQFEEYGLTFSIGGQISFDCFPQGWDKTYCLRHIPEGTYDEIHFFGDKTSEGGNDYELYVDERVQGHSVTSPEDTMGQCRALWLS